MIWILSLHIVSLLFWSASLLYLLSAIARLRDPLARLIFTSIATPASLLAIASGTAVFMINRTVDPWLMVKMTLVSALVIVHAGAGRLVLRLEDTKRVVPQAWVLTAVAALLMLAILWNVLAKPGPGGLP